MPERVEAKAGLAGSARTYPGYPASTQALEESVLETWRAEETFRRTLAATAEAPEFVFYEGPPTANGRPGTHHVISRTIKDLVCRYQTMLGRHVTRIAGWDTHGLPVEIEAEKKLGISGKRQIEALGIERFNAACRESVFTYKEEWERLSERIGYWLDYSSPYVTFAPAYIETVWWILRQLHDRGLIYRGHRSVPYCPRCGTALSSHEVAQGYDDVEDPSIYFLAPFLEPDGSEDAAGRAFLVWTTTPWTLPANVALALNADLTYVEVEHEGRRLVLAEPRLHAVLGEDARILRVYSAAELAGQRYRRPFDLIPAEDAGSAWRVLLEPFVTADDGTGIVHLAPAFGADDFSSGQRHGLPMLRPVDDAGRFVAETPLVGGRFVKDADPHLVEDLTARGLVFRYLREVHTYPHCWRCGSPLLYMARESWYIRTTAMKAEMLRNNAAIDWHPPEMGTGRFGEWLEGNVDWALSRERYWGTPLPAWVCDREAEHVDFIGAFAELADRVGPLGPDFDPHRPRIDELAWPCPRCGGTMRRTPEVIDVWFDSGSMPYAQWHYPFENDAAWRRHFPADFICEGVDQTRGWFYSLMAIASMLGHGPAFRHVVVNDLLLDAEGQKMSKSRGNVVNPWDAIAEFGADPIRWYLLTASQPWVPKRFDPAALGEATRRTFDTLAHTYRFFALYANLESWAPSAHDPEPAERGLLDRWILSRTAALAASVKTDLDAYEITRAARSIGDFIVDDLSNWYVRRARDRFWGSGDAADTRAAFATLHEVLVLVTRLLAPFTPFHADWLHRGLTGRSVHLERFPGTLDGVPLPGRTASLEAGMAAVRELVRLGRAARERARIRVRQPLRTLYAVAPPAARASAELLALLREELNIKEVRFLERADELLVFRAVPNFRALGKRFGGRTQQAADAIRNLESTALSAFKGGAALAIELAGERFALTAEEIELREEPRGELVVEVDGASTVALDTRIDETLRLEGLARELVNRIQRQRRDAGLQVSDRIRIRLHGDAQLAATVARHGEWIAGEVLAVELIAEQSLPPEGAPAQSFDVDGIGLWIALSRAEG
jgi:isoleucyl-tRNA synthetase